MESPYSLEELVDKEHEAGKQFGPMHRQWLLNQPRVPERIRKNLTLAKLYPNVVGTRQGFSGMDVNDFPPTNFTAVTTSSTETNLWTPAIWTPIPANDMRAGKVYKVSFGGIFSTNSTASTSIWTPRAGQSSTPATNVTLGASNTTAPPVSLSAQAWYGEFTMGVRSIGLAASGATVTGNGFVVIQGAAAATGVMYVMGGAIPTTIDNTAASGLVVSLTISVTGQSYTCEWVVLRSYN